MNTGMNTNMNVNSNTFEELKQYYDKVLNIDKSTYKSSNDEPTPIDCVIEMVSKIPEELFLRQNLSILDPCCGNGNFGLVIYYKLLLNINNNSKMDFNDINELRTDNVRKIFGETVNVSNYDFIGNFPLNTNKYDLIMANPPYAKLLENGTRASKNHNLIKVFIEKSLELLKPGGYLLLISLVYSFN